MVHQVQQEVDRSSATVAGAILQQRFFRIVLNNLIVALILSKQKNNSTSSVYSLMFKFDGFFSSLRESLKIERIILDI